MGYVTFDGVRYTLVGKFRRLNGDERVALGDDQPKKRERKNYRQEKIKPLFEGATISREGDRFAIRNATGHKVFNLSVSEFLEIKKYLWKQTTDGRYLLSRPAIMRAKCDAWIKKYYLTIKRDS